MKKLLTKLQQAPPFKVMYIGYGILAIFCSITIIGAWPSPTEILINALLIGWALGMILASYTQQKAGKMIGELVEHIRGLVTDNVIIHAVLRQHNIEVKISEIQDGTSTGIPAAEGQDRTLH